MKSSAQEKRNSIYKIETWDAKAFLGDCWKTCCILLWERKSQSDYSKRMWGIQALLKGVLHCRLQRDAHLHLNGVRLFCVYKCAYAPKTQRTSEVYIERVLLFLLAKHVNSNDTITVFLLWDKKNIFTLVSISSITGGYQWSENDSLLFTQTTQLRMQYGYCLNVCSCLIKKQPKDYSQLAQMCFWKLIRILWRYFVLLHTITQKSLGPLHSNHFMLKSWLVNLTQDFYSPFNAVIGSSFMLKFLDIP